MSKLCCHAIVNIKTLWSNGPKAVKSAAFSHPIQQHLLRRPLFSFTEGCPIRSASEKRQVTCRNRQRLDRGFRYQQQCAQLLEVNATISLLQA